jgi:hypothetical protein
MSHRPAQNNAELRFKVNSLKEDVEMLRHALERLTNTVTHFATTIEGEKAMYPWNDYECAAFSGMVAENVAALIVLAEESES